MGVIFAFGRLLVGVKIHVGVRLGQPLEVIKEILKDGQNLVYSAEVTAMLLATPFQPFCSDFEWLKASLVLCNHRPVGCL